MRPKEGAVMIRVKRDLFLNRLKSRRFNGMVKVITGLRRCGKSYLLGVLYKEYLISLGVSPDHVIEVALDEPENFRYHNPLKLDAYLKSKLQDDGEYYIFIDEVQFVKRIKVKDPMLKDPDEITFYSVINALMRKHNVDVYVTGSNSKMLSSDIRTEFRGRGDEVRLTPFTFAEYMQVFGGDARDAWDEYVVYGGMPLATFANGHEAKSRYLKGLFEETYIKDVVERNAIRKPESLGDVLDVLASAVGSLTNSVNLENTFRTIKRETLKAKTIDSYINKLCKAFLIEEARRYDIKGRRHIGALRKYYFADLGLRNARLGFRQVEESHLMENAIFNELTAQGFDVDVGIVDVFEKNAAGSGIKKHLEIDFVANRGRDRFYIQSALNIDAPEKAAQEKRPFRHLDDSFREVVVVKGKMPLRIDDSGCMIVGLIDFLLKPSDILGDPSI